MKAKLIKNIINDYLENKDLNDINILVQIEKIWKNELGSSIFNNTKVINYCKGTLFVETSNSVWRNELFFQKKKIIKKLKKQLKFNIKEIKFK